MQPFSKELNKYDVNLILKYAERDLDMIWSDLHPYYLTACS